VNDSQAARPIGASPLHPLAERGLGEVQVPGDGRDRLALVEDQAHRLGLEVVIELPHWSTPT